MENKGFIKQVRNFNVKEVLEPKTYLRWNNTEDGRDISDCYERIVINSEIFYVNCHNRNSIVSKDNPFFHTLNKMYMDFKLTEIEKTKENAE